MQVKILVGGVYRGCYYNAEELCDMPETVAETLIKRKLAAATAAPVVEARPPAARPRKERVNG